MARSSDSSAREHRIVFMMSPDELRALDAWRFVRKIATRAEAIRRLVAEGTARTETREQLTERLSEMEPDDAAREACGHPLVSRIDLNPVTIHFTDGSRLSISEAVQ